MGGVDRLPGEIAEALERGATVVTGNQRAARTLRHAFDLRNRDKGLVSWRPPAVAAWETWTTDLWRLLIVEGHATAVLMNSAQEHAVWRAVLAAGDERNTLRSVDSLAAMASDAWRLLCRYNGRSRLRSAAGSTDTRAFQRWAQEFERRCRVDDLLSAVQLEESLRVVLERGLKLELPGEILLDGFDGLVPAQVSLIEAVRATGAHVTEVASGVSSQWRVLVTAKDEIEEIGAAARWIRQYLDERPEARVAVIVPGLEEQRARIDRVFREVLAPELEDIATSREIAPYEFSLGVPLASMPMIAAALDLLRWTMGSLPLAQVSRLLLSPYFAAEERERGGRAEFDAFAMRRADLLRPEVTLQWLRVAIEGWRRRAKVPQLLATLQRMTRVVEERFASRERRSFAGWAEAIGELLEAAAWGAGAGEDSLEFQTRRKWESALDELATLDFNSTRVEFREAFGRLEWIARETMFAVESREAQVQVMGPLESAGSQFDAVWFLRAGDLSWPAATSGNPLLPWHLRRELRMPGTDAAHDEARSRLVTRRISECAERVIFSYAVETADGHQHRSPVLNDLEMDAAGADEIAPSMGEKEVVVLEAVKDSDSLPLLPDAVIRGGAEILRLQAACGFRAFAECRLWSTELRHSEMGLDAAGRGTIVHYALERFWDEVKTQERLKRMSAAERDTILKRAIEESLSDVAALRATAWDDAYVDLQQARLQRLLEPWLELEMKRAPFEVKLSERAFKDVRIGPLRLDVRVDRVDAGEEGDILIDYKTGAAKPGEWLTERPEAPQLPLYAVLSEAERLEAVAFAEVRPGKEMTLTGYATSDHALIKPVRLKEAATLDAQVERWEQILTDLATDFYNGDARVRPKRYPATCAYCAQRILCRLDVSSLDEDAEEGAAVEDEHG